MAAVTDRKEFHELVDPATARNTIAALPIEPGTETVPLEAARGRVLAERLDASIDVPGFDRAVVDGYAVRSRDLIGADEGNPVELRVLDVLHAGEKPERELEPGTAIEISTGAVIPPGSDAVVMVERTRATDDTVAVETTVPPGGNIMSAGVDVAAGDRAIGAGRVLTARDIALLAAIGQDIVPVHRQPRIGIVSTGDELVRPGDALDSDRGEIFDVNSHALVAAIEAAGGDPILYPHVEDEAGEMEAALERAAAECELVLSSGSTSASAVDVIYRVIEDRGEIIHHGVGVKPGKPMIIGRMGEDDSAYVGLPGFPVSALMTFREFVAPSIRAAAGLPAGGDPRVTASMIEEARFDEGRMRLLPVGLVEDANGEVLAYPVDKGSGATTSLANADGVVAVPASTAFVGAQEAVTVRLFEADVRPPRLLAVGEPDPLFNAALDRVGQDRFLTVGTTEGRRRFEQGIPDVAVLAGEIDSPPDGERIGTWQREWGLVVDPDVPRPIEGIADIVDADLTFANAGETALLPALDEALASLAADRALDWEELTGRIEGYGVTRPGLESAARLVARGDADVAVGLAATAAALDLAFVSLGRQPVLVIAHPTRREKPGVCTLVEVLEDSLDHLLAERPGYRRLPP